MRIRWSRLPKWLRFVGLTVGGTALFVVAFCVCTIGVLILGPIVFLIDAWEHFK